MAFSKDQTFIKGKREAQSCVQIETVLIFHFYFDFSRPKLSFQLEYIVAEKFRGGWGDGAPEAGAWVTRCWE